MSALPVPGARLHFDTRGSGSLMVLVPGASGTGRVFTRLVDHLVADYTVATYDRRGFSGSRLDGPQHDERLKTDADDVRRLIEHLGDQPATVFGTSSGAIVALELITRHPGAVHTVVAAEPPAMRLLPDGQVWIDAFHDTYDLYQRSGLEPALQAFRERTFTAADGAAMARAADLAVRQSRADATHWFEHELRQYPAVQLDLAALRTYAERIIVVAGRDSTGTPAHRASVALAQRLGLDVTLLPGGHVGLATQPTDFARDLQRALSRQDPVTTDRPV